MLTIFSHYVVTFYNHHAISFSSLEFLCFSSLPASHSVKCKFVSLPEADWHVSLSQENFQKWFMICLKSNLLVELQFVEDRVGSHDNIFHFNWMQLFLPAKAIPISWYVLSVLTETLTNHLTSKSLQSNSCISNSVTNYWN